MQFNLCHHWFVVGFVNLRDELNLQFDKFSMEEYVHVSIVSFLLPFMLCKFEILGDKIIVELQVQLGNIKILLV